MNRIRKQIERPIIMKRKTVMKKDGLGNFLLQNYKKIPPSYSVRKMCEEVYFIIFFETLISPRDLGNATKATTITAEYQMIFASLFRLLFRKTHMRGTIFHISLFSVHYF